MGAGLEKKLFCIFHNLGIRNFSPTHLVSGVSSSRDLEKKVLKYKLMNGIKKRTLMQLFPPADQLEY